MPKTAVVRFLIPLITLLPSLACAEVFINELHYDNASTDVGEAIEVVATAGEDLSQYSLHFYNGNGGGLSTSTSPNIQPVANITTVACGASINVGFVTPNQIENGAPDGVALVGPGNTLVQLLSWEGSFVATAGIAVGVTSTNLPVSEDPAPAAGTSLQLGGNATTYAGFVWNTSAAATFGTCNNGQTFGAAVDNPPAVISSTPSQGASEVAVSSAINLTFSENVSVSAAGISLLCNAAAQTLSLSGNNASHTLTPSANLPFGASCTLTVPAASVTDLDGSVDPMDADFVLDFDTLEDFAPILLSSTPADGAMDFPANANLQLTFSEPVTLGASWFQIACVSSGTRQVDDTAVTGGPSAYSVNPDVDFVQGESCALQLTAAQIIDQDGNADTFVGPTSISFTPAAAVVNQPPVVVSTTPMDGDADFPPFADLVVLFSEAVTLQTGAFALSCDTSSGIVLGYPLNGTSFTIDTGTALVAGDSCTFTITRTLVQDSEGANPAADTIVEFTVASGSVSGYYSQVNTSSPEQLRCSLHDTIKGHTLYPYGWTQLEDADEDPNVASSILDIYRNCSYPKPGARVGGAGAGATCGSVTNLRYNREHVWPRSLGFNNGNNDLAAHNDQHMLHLSDEGFNAHRGNKPFAYCPQASGCSEDRTIANNGDPGGNGTYPGNSNWYTASTDGSNGSYEVWHRWRGNMARAIFYMAIRYEGISSEDAHDGNIPDLELTDSRALIVGTSNTAAKAWMGLLTVLLEWHAQDPVDARELERNEIVFGYQGNRNPFVDHPEWATAALFNSTQPAVCEPNGGNLPPVANDDFYNVTEDSSLTVLAPGVLGNDSDPEGNSIIAELVSSVSSGSLSFAATGGFIYTPAGNFCGDDSFGYRARDATGSSAVALATIAVACVNDTPVASNATFALAENSVAATVVGQVVASDVDVADTLSYAITAGNGSGAFAISASGQITVANAMPLDFEATPQFVLTVSVSDNGVPVRSTTATITVNLTNVEEGPATAVDDMLGVDEDSIDAVLNVLANDLPDPDGEAFAITSIGSVAHGTVSFDANQILYSPATDYCGADSVTYTITGGSSATAAILVACINDAPIAVGTLPDRSAEEGVAIVPFPTAGGFDDPDFGDTLAFTATALPPGLSLDPDSGMISGTVLAGGANASPYSVVITATDDGNESVTQAFEYTVAPSPDQIFADGFED